MNADERPKRKASTRPGEPPERSAGRLAPLALPILPVGASLALGVVAAAIFGGTAWIGALLLLGAAIGWSLLDLDRSREAMQPLGAPGNDAAGSRMWLVPVVSIVAALVAAGVIVLGTIAGYL